MLSREDLALIARSQGLGKSVKTIQGTSVLVVKSKFRKRKSIDARPKNARPDSRIIKDFSCVPSEDLNYQVNEDLDLCGLFVEFLRVRKARQDAEASLTNQPKLNARQYRLIKRAIARNDRAKIESILSEAMTQNW